MTITGLKVYKFVAILSTVVLSIFMLQGIVSGISLEELVHYLGAISVNVILYPIIVKASKNSDS
ncbi:hypothetical protein [Lacticaseibacillus saniviri]|uniref:Uncharacterized protein n=1 Tax=Lacticaseibacillus saniviri JCM 17471 = DSM 24301 TaxID=1293598 RepID=A0A0R2MN82_9LACO|nr:hypothetical protein [Lacticaseibacillus saniviri]KRO15142.1 hypothetical protein IV56_GL000232 [Lacticaseibacillus saniviri JCM 17471 = DSM 24301]MCG4281153.1 hypothetical protein [Lacticaseibacillus saniviri]